jgi:two-component system, chemotaxis family, protein-glutamate methylesterase/glutaminase
MLQESGFDVVGSAATVGEAEALVDRAKPDLVLSDVRLPDGDGIELTRRLLTRRGLPIVLITAYDPRNPSLVFEALEAGALEVMSKPPRAADPEFAAYRRNLERTLRLLATTPVIRRRQRVVVDPLVLLPFLDTHGDAPPLDEPVLAIGASTGGPPVIADIFRAVRGRRIAFAVVAQHLMADFAESFRSWLASVSGRRVFLAAAGQAPEPGAIYVAPSRSHLRLGRDRRWKLVPAETSTHVHVPCVDELFDSLCHVAPRQTLALLLTGMGRDGAVGLQALRAAGAWTIVQRPDTATVDGMPRSAIERGAAREVLSPEEIVDLLGRLPKLA